MLLGMFRITATRADTYGLAQNFIKALCVITSVITLLEVFLVWVLHVPSAALPWVTYQYEGFYRPFGLVQYPQPNAVILALLFWLSFLYQVRGALHRIMVALALATTAGATGLITFLVLIPLWTRRPFLLSVIGFAFLGSIVGIATMTNQQATGGPLGKFDLVYASTLIRMFSRFAQISFMKFTPNDYLFGSSFISTQASIGLTHDWAYLDVFFVYGIVGVAGYLLLYGTIIFLATPRESKVSMRVFFMLIALLANFHYGTLNYFVGQMLFSVLAALNVYRNYFLPHGKPASVGVPQLKPA